MARRWRPLREEEFLKALQHRIETGAVRFGLWLGRLFPLAVTRRFGAGLGWFAWSVLRVRRSLSTDHIQRALGVGPREANRIGRASYQNLGRNLMEFIAAPRLSLGELREMVRLNGTEHIDAVQELGSGVIVFGGHYGTWEFIVTGFNIHGYPMEGLVAPQSNRQVDEILMEQRRSIHQVHIERDFSLRPILRVLKRNQCIGMLGDQDAGPDGLFVDFFGRPASTPRGAATIALKQGIPIVCVFPTRQPDNSHVLELERVDFDPDLKGEAAVADFTQRITDRLEAAIRRRPELYLWAHKRWKSSPRQGVSA
jgi:KDO2-lipid IV(A) lauroyltransferase